MPTAEQVQQAVEVFAAGALCVGAIGTALEELGERAKFPKLVALGRALEDFAANIPRLLGKEKPRA
jgi:hypothetical protein